MIRSTHEVQYNPIQSTGMDAGRAFNTFPLMAGRWIPEEYWSDRMSPLRNFFENTAAVQVGLEADLRFTGQERFIGS